MKKSIRERLTNKKIKELKSIYVRITGHDLLRGSKQEMIHTLLSLLNAKKYWKQITG